MMGDDTITSASASRRVTDWNAGSKSPRVATCKIASLRLSVCAAASIARRCIGPVAGSQNTATLAACGTASFSASSKIEKDSRDVAAGPCNARSETARDGIALQVDGHDGNARRRRLCRPHGRRADGCDEVNLTPDEIGRQWAPLA